MNEWLTFVVVDPVKVMLAKIWGYIPSIAGAIIILVIGWLIAKLLETLVIRILKTIRLDTASDKAGISNILAQGEIKVTLSELIGAIIYWIIILVVMATALNALNLTIAAELVTKLVGYVPSILGALFIMVIGTFLANFVAGVVKTAANNAGLKQSALLVSLTRTIIMVFAVIIAIEQLQIASAVIILAVNIILISIGLGIALAFGLGCKDLAGRFVADMIENLKK